MTSLKMLDPEDPLRLYYISKLSLLLLSKLLLPEIIFALFTLQHPQLFAKFFTNCSFKQKHYLMTQML